MERLFIQLSDDAYISISQNMTGFVLQGHIYIYSVCQKICLNLELFLSNQLWSSIENIFEALLIEDIETIVKYCTQFFRDVVFRKS